MARIPSYVKVVTYLSGETRYEVRIETGKRDGKRQQQRRRFTKLQDAVDAYNAERGDRSGVCRRHRLVSPCPRPPTATSKRCGRSPTRLPHTPLFSGRRLRD
jgi:hypothetical protein